MGLSGGVVWIDIAEKHSGQSQGSGVSICLICLKSSKEVVLSGKEYGGY